MCIQFHSSTKVLDRNIDNFSKPYYNKYHYKKEGNILANTISKDTTIGNLLSVAPEAAPILMEIGMHCLG